MAFVKLINKQCFLKAVIFGDTGSGKTTIAEKLAIGLSQKTKKVYILDSEGGIDFFANHLAENGIECFVSNLKLDKFDTFARELETAIKDKPDCIIIDSITHFGELCQQEYVDSKGENMKMIGWGQAKKAWNTKVATPLKNAECHILVCGRETSGIAIEKNAAGKSEIKYSNPTKTRSGFDIDYELNLLINMESRIENNTQVRVAKILKDRSNKIDGAEFINPVFDDIMPHLVGLGNSDEVKKQKEAEQQALFIELKRKINNSQTKEQLSFFGEQIKDAKSALTEQQFKELIELGTTKKQQLEKQQIDDEIPV